MNNKGLVFKGRGIFTRKQVTVKLEMWCYGSGWNGTFIQSGIFQMLLISVPVRRIFLLLFLLPQHSVLEILAKFHFSIYENLVLRMYFHYLWNYAESSHILI